VPLFYQQNINENTKLAIWKIEEPEGFFLSKVPLQREITHPLKRLQHLAARYLLPFLFPDFPYSEIEIADTRKPFLPNEQYHFSISHCNRYAAAIVSKDWRVGIDAEFITSKLEKIKAKFLHHEELNFVNLQPAGQQLKLLSLLWSGKEAVYKWYGAGSVNFSEMIRIFPFHLMDEGNIKAAFIKNNFKHKLILHYKFTKELTLVWAGSE
jgi:4'-phosphopantetheinyl transferase EntD